MNNNLPTNMTDEKDVHKYFNDVFKSVIQKCIDSSDDVVSDKGALVMNECHEPETYLKQKPMDDEKSDKTNTLVENIGSSSEKDNAKKGVVAVARILDDYASILEKKKAKKKIDAKDLMDLIRRNDNRLRLSVLQKLFREQFECDLTCKKLTEILNVSSNIRNHIVAFKSFKWKVFEVPTISSDPFIVINEAGYETFCQNNNADVLSQIPKELVDSWSRPLVASKSEEDFLQPKLKETISPEDKMKDMKGQEEEKSALPEVLELPSELDAKKSEETKDDVLKDVDACLEGLKEELSDCVEDDDEIPDSSPVEKRPVDDSTALVVPVPDNNDEKASRFSDPSLVNSYGSGCSGLSYNTLDNLDDV